MNENFFRETDSKNAALKRHIIKLCIDSGSYSIADLSSKINASVPTVTKLINELIEEGFIQDLGKQGTSGGRRPSIYGLSPKAGYFIGVDIARQHFHIAICDFKGELVDFIQDIEFVLEDNPESFRSLCQMIRTSVTHTGRTWNHVLGVGVSLSGRVNPEKGYSLTYFVTEDIPLKDFFEKFGKHNLGKKEIGMLYNMVHHDENVADAREAGRVAGRNESIKAEMNRERNTDGMPRTSNGAAPVEAVEAPDALDEMVERRRRRRE